MGYLSLHSVQCRPSSRNNWMAVAKSQNNFTSASQTFGWVCGTGGCFTVCLSFMYL